MLFIVWLRTYHLHFMVTFV